jgi:hypothetical protein
MTRTCRAVFALVLLVSSSSIVLPAHLRAASGPRDPPSAVPTDTPLSAVTRPAAGERRIRTTDRRVRALIEQAVFVSPTLRALVDRLERSDVVVYVTCERYADSRVAGRLTFVSAAGGLRYVLVRLMRLESRAQQIALLAHELQHAAEIADTPAIVDSPSLAREYQRFGHVSPWSTKAGVAFDTTAAVETGQKVLAEIVAEGD